MATKSLWQPVRKNSDALPAGFEDGARRRMTPVQTLTFNWERKRLASRARLALYLLVSLALHIGCFYVFQVVYPTPSHTAPIPSSVLLLSRENPAAREVLREIDDRVAAYDITVEDHSPEYTLEDLGLAYRPSFADVKLEPLDLRRPIRSLFPPPDIGAPNVLPPVPGPLDPSEPTAPGDPAEPSIIFGGDLEGRKLEPGVGLPSLAPYFERKEGAAVEFLVGVTAPGIVARCLLNTNSGVSDPEPLAREMAKLRFVALREPGLPGLPRLQWGTVTIEW